VRPAAFKYTFPISKAEKRADGYYIVGEASGPEIDLEGERVTVEAIASFSRQIELAAEMGDPIPYRDAHAKDGVLRDLGVVTKAWITPDFHLGVEVRLDVEDNPAALSLFKQITNKGKQFGMSVAGHVLDWADEYVAEVGTIVRTYKDVVLEEISNTTRPAWFPSFGTVLSKAIKDAEDEESDAVGDSVEDELQTEQETPETPAVDENTEQPEVEETVEAAAEESAEEPAEEAAAAEGEAVEESAEETAEAIEEAAEAVEAGEEAVEEAEEAEDEGVMAQFRQHLETFHSNLTEMLTAMGSPVAPVMVTKSVSQDDESTMTKAISDATAPLVAQVAELRKSLDEATARIEELENSPAGDDAPPAMAKHSLTPDDIEKALDSMSPSERLRLGLRARFNR